MAITRCRSCPCICDSRATSRVFRGTRVEASARLFFHRRCWDKGPDDRRAGARSSRTHKLIQSFFESGIRFANTLGVLNNCFTIGKESSHGESHRNSMIAETGHSRAPQRCRSEEHTSELQSQSNLVCRLLLEKKKRANSDTRVPRAVTL